MSKTEFIHYLGYSLNLCICWLKYDNDFLDDGKYNSVWELIQYAYTKPGVGGRVASYLYCHR